MMVGSPEVDLGIQAKVDFPNEVGVDRLVNAIGAQVVHPTPLIVVDIGTATTFDIVDEGRRLHRRNHRPGAELRARRPAPDCRQAAADRDRAARSG